MDCSTVWHIVQTWVAVSLLLTGCFAWGIALPGDLHLRTVAVCLWFAGVSSAAASSLVSTPGADNGVSLCLPLAVLFLVSAAIPLAAFVCFWVGLRRYGVAATTRPLRLLGFAYDPALTGTIGALVVTAAHLLHWQMPLWLAAIVAVFWLTSLPASVRAGRQAFWTLKQYVSVRRPRNGSHATDEGWSRTPFAAGDAPTSRASTAAQGATKEHDVFISYKSEDVGVARALAEQLIAAGLQVWFAEYYILLTDRDQFQRAIDEGIRGSRFGIALTNDRYVSSAYCRSEIEQLLAPENCGPERVLEVRIPSEERPHQDYPSLARSPYVEWRGEVADVLGALHSMTGHSLTAPAEEGRVPEGRAYFGGPGLSTAYSLDVAAWPGRMLQGQPVMRRTCCGRSAEANVLTGPMVPLRAPDGMTGAQDDRRIYDWVVGFSQMFMATTGFHCAGVHLLFLDGYSHPGLTYWAGGCWSRRYAVTLPDPTSGIVVELAFLFLFRGPFDEFCAAVSAFDRLVASFRWEPLAPLPR
ncbi:toll/interleukin-1 receptor domain-containing protein [bacterium]|nr:toll/interleukin-1 receptor domain-containing protein [bacterium]